MPLSDPKVTWVYHELTLECQMLCNLCLEHSMASRHSCASSCLSHRYQMLHLLQSLLCATCCCKYAFKCTRNGPAWARQHTRKGPSEGNSTPQNTLLSSPTSMGIRTLAISFGPFMTAKILAGNSQANVLQPTPTWRPHCLPDTERQQPQAAMVQGKLLLGVQSLPDESYA